MAKNTESKDKGNTKKQRFSLSDERVKITAGLLVVFFAAFLTLAFISFLFTWKVDQSFEWSRTFSSSSIVVENWSGKTGARIANLFMNKWFGIASFSFPFLMFLIGFHLLHIKTLPLWKTIKHTLILTVLLSFTLGFFFGSTNGFLGSGLGGGHGYIMSHWFNAFIGKVGTFFLLVSVIFAYVVFSFDNVLPALKRLLKSTQHQEKNIAEGIKEGVNQFAEDIPEEQNEEKMIFTDDVEFTAQKSFVEKEDEEVEEVSEVPSAPLVSDPGFTVMDTPLDPVEDADSALEAMGEYDPTLDLSHYKFPGLDLLEDHKSENSEVSNDELINNKNKIVETLGNYKIPITKIKATIGPTVTLYEIVPAPGIRISKIKNLEDDIALSLSALGIRIIAPIPGKGTIGIEVPNMKPEIVSMRSILASRRFQESKYELPIALGKTISNETYVFDLTAMPHLLVAGATGQGKSVGLNAMITSLLYKKHPSQLKFVLVDPKKVELTLYSKIEKYFLAKLPDSEEAIITDTQKVINTLNSLTIEMDQRYDLLKMAHVRNIKEYNTKFIARKLNPEYGHRYLPYIVVIIDEFADLIMTAGREIETPIARLAQLARAIGIHLIIATQRPTTNIITGVIKANFPARVAFRVSSAIDSRTILDGPGANQLVGRGDMLIAAGDMKRIQCAFIDISEIERITDFISQQQSYPSAMLLPEYLGTEGATAEVDLNKRDEMFDEAARLVVMHQQGSTSLIQRKFSIGYNRAGRIMDQLEAANIVGPNEGSKARQVLYTDEYSLEQYLNTLK